MTQPHVSRGLVLRSLTRALALRPKEHASSAREQFVLLCGFTNGISASKGVFSKRVVPGTLRTSLFPRFTSWTRKGRVYVLEKRRSSKNKGNKCFMVETESTRTKRPPTRTFFKVCPRLKNLEEKCCGA